MGEGMSLILFLKIMGVGIFLTALFFCAAVGAGTLLRHWFPPKVKESPYASKRCQCGICMGMVPTWEERREWSERTGTSDG